MKKVEIKIIKTGEEYTFYTSDDLRGIWEKMNNGEFIRQSLIQVKEEIPGCEVKITDDVSDEKLLMVPIYSKRTIENKAGEIMGYRKEYN